MSPERWRQIEELYHAACECGPTILADADAELRRDVEKLLAQDSGDRILDQPAAALLEESTIGSDSSDRGASPVPNDSFGTYEPIRVLGEGGMGTVYLARQRQPIRREVALKVVKLGMNSRQVVARFENERQALALMDHPNIAHVFEAGTSNLGRPYFVMEYVDGVTITQYCDQDLLNTRERLELFSSVCLALQHAHQKGVIHRDIKPSNVLVTKRDGKPCPKVIDFGIARATEQRLAEHSAFTLLGNLVGTPEYMSPEQADLSCQDIDTTTDVYSLGILLYQLLAGALPFDGHRLRKSGIAELLRIIREEEPPTPSAKLMSLGDKATEVARCRRTDPGTLRRQLAGDLNWIVMKAMDKVRKRRYASASEFAADIRRHLDDLPVVARPPDTLYRARKFIRRHRLPVLAGLLVAASLAAGLVAVTWEARVAEARRQEAEVQRARANAEAAQARVERSRAGQTAREADEQRAQAEKHRLEAEAQRRKAETEKDRVEAEKRRVEVVQEQLKTEERSRTEAEKRGVEAQSVIALSGGPVDEETTKKLEAKVSQNPADRDSQDMLIRNYVFFVVGVTGLDKYGQVNAVDPAKAASPFAQHVRELLASSQLAAVCGHSGGELWRYAIRVDSYQRLHPSSGKLVVDDALRLAIQLIDKAIGLEPENAQWRDSRIWTVDYRAKYDALGPAEAYHMVTEDLARLKGELRHRHLAKAGTMALKASALGDARTYAKEMIESPANSTYGDDVFYGNMLLGQLALRGGDRDGAIRFLLASGKTPGSSMLSSSSGPTMTLAKELLDAGERDAVLRFLDLCRAFWKSDNGRLQTWADQVRSGKTPAFGRNLIY
jgi:serine/threonine protein kinase